MKNKFASLPKKFRITKKNPAVWRSARERYFGWLIDFNFFGHDIRYISYPLFLRRPICWLFGHKNKIIYPYGAKVKQCQRCGRVFYRKPIKGESYPKIFKGEVGKISGVRFFTKRKEKIKQSYKHQPKQL